MKRVCFLGRFTAGGTERSTLLLANALSENSDRQVHVLNVLNRPPTFFLSPAVIYDFLPYDNEKAKLLYNIRFLRSYLKSHNIDALISVEALTGLVSIPATRAMRCKHIVWEHANCFQTQGSRWMKQVRTLELTYGCADAYVVLTKRDLSNFRQYYWIRIPIHQIYNLAKPVKKECFYATNSKRIVSAGHHNRMKNFTVIPEIGRIIFEKHPDWVWEIYGGRAGEHYENLKKRICAYSLEKNIILRDFHENIGDVYARSAIYVMTSIMEGLPMVLLEAKAHGLPIVSFDIETGPDEILRHGVNGYLVPPYDVQQMAGKICELIENQSLRERFSLRAQEDLEKFSEERCVAAWNEIFCSL